MEKWNILLGYSLFHPTKLNLMKYHGKLCDRGCRSGAKYLPNLLGLKKMRFWSLICSSEESVVFLVKVVLLWWCYFAISLGWIMEKAGVSTLC